MNDSPHTTDEYLVSLVQQGDKEKFGILMERYEQRLFRYARKFISYHSNVEDVVQEVFIKAYQNIQSFDLNQKFSPWIYRIAHNTFINILKKDSREPISFFDFDVLVSYPATDDPDVKEKEVKYLKEMLDKGLDKLKPQYREVIILYFLEELSYKEIADILRIPIGTVGIRLRRAKDALKKICEELGLMYE